MHHIITRSRSNFNRQGSLDERFVATSFLNGLFCHSPYQHTCIPAYVMLITGHSQVWLLAVYPAHTLLECTMCSAVSLYYTAVLDFQQQFARLLHTYQQIWRWHNLAESTTGTVGYLALQITLYYSYRFHFTTVIGTYRFGLISFKHVHLHC